MSPRTPALVRIDARVLAALGVLLVLLSCAGVVLRPTGYPLAAWWPASGVAFLALAVTSRRDWVPVALVILAATTVGNLLGDRSMLVSLLLGVANLVESVVSALLFLSTGGRTIVRVRDLGRLAMSAVAGACAGAWIAGLTIAHLTDGDAAMGLRSFLTSHPAGVLLLAPAVLVVASAAPVRPHLVEFVSQVLLLGGVCWFTFGQEVRYPTTFMPIAVLLWAAARFGPRITSVQVLAVSTCATLATLNGRGAFAPLLDTSSSWSMALGLNQLYLACVVLMMITLSLTVNTNHHNHRRLSDSETLFRRTFDESMLGMLLVARSPGPDEQDDDAGQIVRINPVAGDLLGLGAADLEGTCFADRVLAADQERAVSALADVFSGATDYWHGQLWMRGGDNTSRAVSVSLSPLRGPRGNVERVSVQLLDVTEQHQAQQRLTEMALRDPLTGLGNRALLEEKLQQNVEHNRRSGTQLLLMYLDLDDFKNVNDSAGHEVGDQVLLEVARRLVSQLRPSDTIARMGGDEFVVLAPTTSDEPERTAQMLGDRVLKAILAPMEIGERTYRVGTSVGMTLSRPTSTSASLLREADAAMYQAKRQGKNCIALFSQDHLDQATRKMTLLSELHEALEHNQFELHVQPLIDLPTGAVLGGEALVRWRHPQRGLLAPAEWLDIAESSDMVHPLGHWVIQEACRLAADWKDVMGADSPVIHANISARQLGHGTLVGHVNDALVRHGLSADKLVLELTETQLERSEKAVQDDFEGLRAAGIHLAADDFGTGYSSLTRLTDLPIDILKIDRRFVAKMHADDRARAVVKALVTMGSTLGLDVVAEGVETVADAEQLRQLGCGQAQGYLWSRPLPAADFLELAQQRSVATFIPGPRNGRRPQSPGPISGAAG